MIDGVKQKIALQASEMLLKYIKSSVVNNNMTDPINTTPDMLKRVRETKEYKDDMEMREAIEIVSDEDRQDAVRYLKEQLKNAEEKKAVKDIKILKMVLADQKMRTAYYPKTQHDYDKELKNNFKECNIFRMEGIRERKRIKREKALEELYKQRNVIISEAEKRTMFINAMKTILYNGVEEFGFLNAMKIASGIQWFFEIWQKGLNVKFVEKLTGNTIKNTITKQTYLPRVTGGTGFMIIFYSHDGGSGKTNLVEMLGEAVTELGLESGEISTSDLVSKFTSGDLLKYDLAMVFEFEPNSGTKFYENQNSNRLNKIIDGGKFPLEKKYADPINPEGDIALVGDTNAITSSLNNRRFCLINIKNTKVIDLLENKKSVVPTPPQIKQAWKDLFYCVPTYRERNWPKILEINEKCGYGHDNYLDTFINVVKDYIIVFNHNKGKENKDKIKSVVDLSKEDADKILSDISEFEVSFHVLSKIISDKYKDTENFKRKLTDAIRIWSEIEVEDSNKRVPIIKVEISKNQTSIQHSTIVIYIHRMIDYSKQQDNRTTIEQAANFFFGEEETEQLKLLS
jgi:hypothetical protein